MTKCTVLCGSDYLYCVYKFQGDTMNTLKSQLRRRQVRVKQVVVKGKRMEENSQEWIYQRLRYTGIWVKLPIEVWEKGAGIFSGCLFTPKFRFLHHKHKSQPHGKPGGHVSLASFLCIHCFTTSYHRLKIVKRGNNRQKKPNHSYSVVRMNVQCKMLTSTVLWGYCSAILLNWKGISFPWS